MVARDSQDAPRLSGTEEIRAASLTGMIVFKLVFRVDSGTPRLSSGIYTFESFLVRRFSSVSLRVSSM